MALIKVTAATALPSVKQSIAELAKSVREAGALPGLEMVQQSLERLDSYCSGRTLDVELVVVSPLEPALAGRVAGWIGGGVPAAPLQTRGGDSVLVELAGGSGLVALRLRIRPISSSPALPAGTPRPALLVLLVGNVTGLHADNLALVERLLEERPVAVLLAPAAEDAVKRLEERSQALAWTTVRLDVTALAEPSLQARLAAAPWDALHELLRAHSALSALQSLNGVFDLALQQQARDLRTKKAAAQAKIGKAGPASAAKPTAPGSELIQDVKTRIQRHAQEFERGAVERLQDLLGLTGGTLARETEALLLSLDELDEREGTTKIETRIPARLRAEAAQGRARAARAPLRRRRRGAQRPAAAAGGRDRADAGAEPGTAVRAAVRLPRRGPRAPAARHDAGPAGAVPGRAAARGLQRVLRLGPQVLDDPRDGRVDVRHVVRDAPVPRVHGPAHDPAGDHRDLQRDQLDAACARREPGEGARGRAQRAAPRPQAHLRGDAEGLVGDPAPAHERADRRACWRTSTRRSRTSTRGAVPRRARRRSGFRASSRRSRPPRRRCRCCSRRRTRSRRRSTACARSSSPCSPGRAAPRRPPSPPRRRRRRRSPRWKPRAPRWRR